MKPLNELLTPLHQEQNFHPSDLPMILTEEEKERVIYWAIDQEKKRYARSMAEKGEPSAKTEQKMAEIDWMQRIDIPAIIASANQRAHWEEERKRDREEKLKAHREEREKMISEWTAGKFYQKIKSHFIHRHGTFFMQPWNDVFIKAVCFFLSADPRFETELGFSFNKGLMIQGTAGLGKTETIRAVSENPLYPIKIISILEIAEQVQQNGRCHLNTQQLLLLDDIGTEPEVINHYGTKINWFKDFIEMYYLENKTFNGLMVTTNLGGEELESRYGYRVRSRIREMFNVISLKGDDLRGKV